MKRALLPAVLLVPLVLSAAGAARPTGEPVERLNALLSTVQDLRKAEREAHTAWANFNGNKAPVQKTIAAMDEARATVEKELRKSTAAGLSADYARELRLKLSEVDTWDASFRRNYDKPSASLGPLQDGDDTLRMAEDAKLEIIALIQRATKNVDAPISPFEAVTSSVTAAIESEATAKAALSESPPDLATAKRNLRTSYDLLQQGLGQLRRLGDGVISAADSKRVENELTNAIEDDRSASRAVEAGGAKSALGELEAAMGRKGDALRALDHALANPPAGVPQPPKAEHAGPTCTAGTWTSGPIAIAAPEAGHPAVYYAETPIPNAAYYVAKRGFKSGGCDLAHGKLKANIEIYDSNAKLTAWGYQFGTAPRPNPGDAPIAFHAGEDCITTETNADGRQLQHHACTVETPKLAYRLPKEGFLVPPGGITQDATEFKVFAVVFNVELKSTVGTAGKVTIKVTWELAT